MTNSPPNEIAPPLDEAGWGSGWIVVQYLLHAVAGVFSGRVLLLAAMGLVFAELGAWGCLGFDSQKAVGVTLARGGAVDPSFAAGDLLAVAHAGQKGYWASFVTPFWQAPAGVNTGIQRGLAGVWRLVVWSLFGVALARLGALHLAHHEKPTAAQVLGRSFAGWFGQAAGPLALVAAAGLLAAPIWLMGLASKASAVGVFVAVFWPVAILLAVAAALVAVAALVGTPLIGAAHAVERPDPFDAVSCGVAYVYQRPLRLLAYVLQAAVVGAVAGAMVLGVLRVGFGVLTVYWAGAGEAADAESGRWLLKAWLVLYDYLPLVFHAAYFWFAAVAVYLLMRRDIDEKMVDEVFVEQDQSTEVA